jgi:hypothetical protein
MVADDLCPATTTTSLLRTRVGGFRRRRSGRKSRRARVRSMFTPGSRVCAYKTAPGRREWPNRDPIGEDGGKNLYRSVRNAPVSLGDVDGRIPIEGPCCMPGMGGYNGDKRTSHGSCSSRMRSPWLALERTDIREMGLIIHSVINNYAC